MRRSRLPTLPLSLLLLVLLLSLWSSASASTQPRPGRFDVSRIDRLSLDPEDLPQFEIGPRTELGRECAADGYDNVKQCLAERYAPQYRFHGDEEHFPSSVEWYLARTVLRFSQDCGGDGDHVAALGALTATSLDDFVREVKERKWWLGCGGSGRLMPSDRASGNRHGFFLQVPNDGNEERTYRGMEPPGERAPRWPVYAHVAQRLTAEADGRPELAGWEIQYWLFFPRDGGVGTGASEGLAAHEGDWEMVALHLPPDGSTIHHFFYADHGDITAYDTNEVTFVDEDGNAQGISEFPDERFSHPVVYVSRSKHASYPTAGTFDAPWSTSDVTDDDGLHWLSRDSVVRLGERHAPLPGRQWIRYGGRWGEIGISAGTSGPTGPAIKGKYCRSKKDDEELLACRPLCLTNVTSDEAWVLLYAEKGFQGPRELHRFHEPSTVKSFHDYGTMDFHDRVRSVEWCLPAGDRYQLWGKSNFRGRLLELPGLSELGRIEDLGDFRPDLGERVSSSRFVE